MEGVVEAAEALAGRGLRGDRYADRRGTFSMGGPGGGYEITLIAAEALAELDEPLDGRGRPAQRGHGRRRISTG